MFALSSSALITFNTKNRSKFYLLTNEIYKKSDSTLMNTKFRPKNHAIQQINHTFQPYIKMIILKTINNTKQFHARLK